MNLTDSATELLKKKYCSHGEKPQDVFKRVGKTISEVMNGDEDANQFTKVMEDLDFLPNSPCIRNAGYSNQVKACFVLPIEDSMESIFKTLHQSALIFKSGGGVGYNFSQLREKGAQLSHGGSSSGIMPFLSLYDSLTEAVKQGGFRRGASMGVLDIDHPEILDFIKEKTRFGTMTNFNLSVMVDDDFMKGVEEDSKIFLRSRLDRRVIKGKFNCRDIFNIICYSAWLNGDPGLLFYDRINQDNPFHEKYPIKSTNPCGEVPLLPYESCCLGSINLANFVTSKGEFDKKRFSNIVRIGTKFLMGMNKICEFPIDECYIAQGKYLRIGLGVMGFADMLMKMGINYDSEETLKVIDKIGKIMQESKKYAPQSVATLSIAPTGSLSILANCSSGIEPVFSKSFTRHLRHGTVKESRESKYLRTAHDISPEWHLKVQARWQQYIDNGVSKTINLPHTATIQDVQDVYLQAWKIGCKGITIFRDGCLGDAGQVLRSTCEDEDCYL